MTTRGVAFLNVGLKHANHLAVSLLSLRDHWDGEIAILVGDEKAAGLAEYCAADATLNGGSFGSIKIVPFTYQKTVSGSMYAAKCDMQELSPFDETVFLDADTLVVGEFTDLWPGNDEETRITQFANWWSTDKRIAKRIEPWRDVATAEVAVQLGARYPAINTGVIGFARNSVLMKRWKEMTLRRVSFICDEIAMQLLFPSGPHVVLPDRFNCSPVYSWDRHGPDVEGADPRIWHGHGFKFLRKETGRQLWVPYYEAALRADVARINSWTDEVPKSPRKFGIEI